MTLADADEWNGLFTFEFLVHILHTELILSVKVYSYDAETDSYSLEHIPQSPFSINLKTQKIEDYCKEVDFETAGFGYTRRSTIVEQPAVVVSAEIFTVKVAPKNTFYKQFIQSSFDRIDNLFVLVFTPEDENGDLVEGACVCAPYASVPCHHFSWSYDLCTSNSQCMWTSLSTETVGSSANSCQACNQTQACMTEYSETAFAIVAQTENILTVTVDLTASLALVGSYRSQLSVFSQGGLHLLIYDRPDYSGFVDMVFLTDMQRLTFDSLVHPVFGYQTRNWSVILLGRFRYLAQCSKSIYNRLERETELEVITFTVETNLEVHVYLESRLVLRADQTLSRSQTHKFKYTIREPRELVELEIRLSNRNPLGRFDNEPLFF